MKSNSFSIELAGLTAGFVFADGGRAPAAFKKRYRPFTGRGEPDILFEVSFKRGRQGPYRPAVSAEEKAVRLKRGDFDCVFDAGTGAGRLTCRPAPQSFDSFLRAFWSRALLRAGGMMLHSAGLVKKGKAYLFLGRSGAGKSTLSRLAAAAGAEIISDEINLLRAAKGRFRVHGSPFWGEMRSGGRQGGWPLGGVFLLQKSGINGLSACSKPEALRLLLRCTVNFSRDAADAARALDNAARLLAGAPRARLAFTKKNAGFMGLIPQVSSIGDTPCRKVCPRRELFL